MTRDMRRSNARARPRRHDESGAIGGIEGLAFGVLVFVFGTLVIVYAWAMTDAKLAATAAAREAARAYVEAAPSQAGAAAELAARQVLTGHQRPYVELEIADATTFRRCGVVDVSVSTQVDRSALPLLGRAAGQSVVVGHHREHVDPYRSGLSGVADCPSSSETRRSTR